MNRYDAEHVCTGHARMTREEWADIYRSAWELYYTPEHVETILRRAEACDVGVWPLAGFLFVFSRFVELENVHPLQSGIFRRKYRLGRRPSLPVEPVWTFYPKYAWEIVSKYSRAAKFWLGYAAMLRRVGRDPLRHVYTDQALTPVSDEETDSLGLFTHNETARSEVQRTRRIAALTHGASALVAAPPA